MINENENYIVIVKMLKFVF